MRCHARVSLFLTVLACAGATLLGSVSAAQAAPAITSFESLTCSENEPIGEPKECNSGTPGQFFKQAGGHPPFGITDFTLNDAEFVLPNNGVKTIRTDLPVGFSTNPEALSRCSQADFNANLDTPEESHCPKSSLAGIQEVTLLLPGPTLVSLVGKAYNLEPPTGMGLEFGIDIPLAFLGGIHVHSFLEGFVSWHKEAEATEEGIASGDYHEFFKIKVGKSLAEEEPPIVRSRLVFIGNSGPGMLTNPTACPGPQDTHLRIETYSGAVATSVYKTTPTSAEENCGALSFAPAFSASTSPETQDEGTQLSTDLKFSLNEHASETEGSDLKNTVVTLPEGFTINPAAARGLQACTPEELNTETIETACPARSEIGTAVLNVPGLPPEALSGKIYLAAKSLPIKEHPYTIYVAVGSKRYGQVVRVEGTVEPNLETGQLTTTFLNNPQGPFSDLKLTFNGGTFADLANPLTCGKSQVSASFTPYANPGVAKTILPELNVAGGSCPETAPFAPTQSSTAEPATAGASSTFKFSLERPQGQQYVKTVKTVLPPGMSGYVPDVTQCKEPQASKGECGSASQIGTAEVSAGAGPEPYTFQGKVYFTGPYNGAPFGLVIVTPVVAGPFNFGNEITRSKIEVNQSSGQVIATTTLPTIKEGIPVKVRSLAVTIDRQGFEHNPTNCGMLSTISTVTSTLGTVKEVPSGFQAEGCSALGFSPQFLATTSAKYTKVNGASLETTINQPSSQANIKSVLVTLPRSLPSRLTTLQKACPEATFAANPYSCPPESEVGSARANTPALPSKLMGPAYLVSHGGAAFPDLDLVMEAEGVRVVVVGNTNIKNEITTTNFATTPDVPVSSITVNLPTGPHSALAGYGNLCAAPLYMPTVITGQNGAQVKLNTRIKVNNCGVQIVGHKVVGNTAYLTVKTFAPGRVSGTGNSNVSSAYRTLSAAQNAVSLKIPLTRRGRRHRRPLKVKLRVGFVPKNKKLSNSSATVTVSYR